MADITFPYTDIEYIKDTLGNAYNLAIALDINDQIRHLKDDLVKGPLTLQLEACIARIQQELIKQEEPWENGIGDSG